MNNFKLTLLQYQASRFLIINYMQKRDGVIVAVCGAGKTEMCFPLLSRLIADHKIAFAIPRIDICRDIYERLSAFYGQNFVGLHTGIQAVNTSANLLVMTTNQLLKYTNYFNLIIIDEVDAFPFDTSPIFYEGVLDCIDNGQIYYLTSTPSLRLQGMHLSTFTIYKRWHNQPLPVPRLIHVAKPLKLNLRTKSIITNRKRKLLIFISTISRGHQFSKQLNNLNIDFDFVYSSHPKRNVILSKFKASTNGILLTTTILERGVTFDDIDVIIIDSDNSFYNKAALVQIAGRVGRKLEYQQGKVYFIYSRYTKTIDLAIKFIKQNNQKI